MAKYFTHSCVSLCNPRIAKSVAFSLCFIHNIWFCKGGTEWQISMKYIYIYMLTAVEGRQQTSKTGSVTIIHTLLNIAHCIWDVTHTWIEGWDNVLLLSVKFWQAENPKHCLYNEHIVKLVGQGDRQTLLLHVYVTWNSQFKGNWYKWVDDKNIIDTTHNSTLAILNMINFRCTNTKNVIWRFTNTLIFISLVINPAQW